MQERRQKHFVYAALGGSMLASLVWLTALCTRGWVELILPEPGVYLPSLRAEDRGKMVLVEKIWAGMWNFCRVEYTNATVDSAVSSVTDSNGLYTLQGTVHKSRPPDLVFSRNVAAFSCLGVTVLKSMHARSQAVIFSSPIT